MRQDVPEVAGFLCDEVTVLGVKRKECPCTKIITNT
jgi:hypothetical protein